VPDDGLPEAIRVRNWIPFTADVDATTASERLVAALDTDLEYVHAHTRWPVKALEWDAKGRDRSFLPAPAFRLLKYPPLNVASTSGFSRIGDVNLACASDRQSPERRS